MAVHKVPQDVEADDKFLGPLSFKQFIFFGLLVICGYLTFLMIAKNLLVLTPVFGIPMVVFGFLAFPWSKEQPTELWLASRIRFMIKPRMRIWDQSGVKQLVDITVPKREVHNYTDGLSQDEVHNRLSALATMVDSRGWAIKNVGIDQQASDDRLVSGNVQNDSPMVAFDNPDDVMDENTGVLAQQFEDRIQQSAEKHRAETKQIMEKARQAAPAADPGQTNTSQTTQQEDFWFMHQQQAPVDPGLATFQASPVVHPGDSQQTQAAQTQTTDDASLDATQLLEQVHEKQRRDQLQVHSSHYKTINPLGNDTSDTPVSAQTPQTPAAAPTADATPDPEALSYVHNNDLSVEAIQRMSHRKDHLPPDEVVVSLH